MRFKQLKTLKSPSSFPSKPHFGKAQLLKASPKKPCALKCSVMEACSTLKNRGQKSVKLKKRKPEKVTPFSPKKALAKKLGLKSSTTPFSPLVRKIPVNQKIWVFLGLSPPLTRSYLQLVMHTLGGLEL